MTMKDTTFKIRAYGKSELALLYFPKAWSARGALCNLNYWINRNAELRASLQDCGMSSKSKHYTPKEVALIVHFLGEPL